MEKKAPQTAARLKWEAACERLAFALQSPDGAPADSTLGLEEAVRLAHAALEEVRAAFGADSTGGSKAALGSEVPARGTYDGVAAGGERMVTIRGEHVHARTGESVTYQVNLDHGPESTYYAARVLLRSATWHELESGTIAGPNQDARTPQVMQAVFAQIDGLDFQALNRC
ncbi:hypothetical protein J7E62_20695 [Variovorax paradoxus]|nr:hypothetical protein [Variovorax paradoxus]